MRLGLISGTLAGIAFRLRVSRRWGLKQLCDGQYAWQVFELVKNHGETTLRNTIFVVLNTALTIASTTLIVCAVNIRKRWPLDGSACAKVRRIKEANRGCSRKGEDKGFENEHRGHAIGRR